MNKSLSGQDGLIIGVNDAGNFRRSDSGDYQHVLLLAPAGAGKGVSFVIPNLLSWQESVIVHDIKLENYAITSGWRASQGQKIYLFDPLNSEGKTHCYNPLDFISNNSDQIIDDIHKIATLLIPENDFWHSNARNLFVGLVLYISADPSKTRSFGEIFRLLTGDLNKELSDGLNALQLNQASTTLINSFLNKSEKWRTKIVSILTSYLELWGNPLIDKATSRSDFNPADFRKEKSTLYVGLRPGDINRLKPLMQFFYQHIAQNLIKEIPDVKKEPHGVLLMIDEFPTIGKMDVFTSCIPYFRGYKLKLLLIAECSHSIRATYGTESTNIIFGNSNSKIFFTANSFETAFFISHLSIDKLKKEVSISWQEAMSLSRDQQIILADHEQPLISKKLRYFNYTEFKNKIMNPMILFK